MTPSQAYRAALEAAAKVAEDYPEITHGLLSPAQVYQATLEAKEIAVAIRALPVPPDDGDMVLVPKDPTAEMLEEGKKAWKKPRLHVSYNPADELNTCGVIYRAMIEAKEKP